jgi:hypothetical protein
MRKAVIVATTVVVLVVALGTSGYLWVRAAYFLPGASCGTVGASGLDDQTRLVTGASRAPQCFLAAARTCAAAGLRVVHTYAGEGSTDYVFIINAGGAPGRCQVTEYSQYGDFLGPARVRVTGCREESVTSKGVLLSCPNLSGTALIPPAVAGFPKPNPLMLQFDSATSCGSVFAEEPPGLGPGTRIVTAAGFNPRTDQATLNCFAAATRTCAHASIGVIPQYAPDDMETAFAIERGGRPSACQVARMFPVNSPIALVGFDSCRETSVTSKGVLLTCGRQVMLIPAKVAKIVRA